MRRRIYTLTLLIAALCAYEIAWAADYGPLMTSARSRAMGGIGVGIIDDEHALFMNPAGLAGLEDRKLKVTLTAEGSLDVYDAYTTSSSLFDNFSVSTLNQMLGRNIDFRGGALVQFFGPNFAIAGLVDSQAAVYSQNQVSPEYDLGYMTTNGVQAGMGWSIKPGKKSDSEFRIGAGVKFLNRRGGYYHLYTSDLLTITDGQQYLKNKVGSYSFGLGIDAGIQYIKHFGKMTTAYAGFSAMDIPKTAFRGAAQDIDMNMSLGVGIRQRMEFLDLSAGIDFQNLTQSDSFSNKFHFGTEVGFPFMKLWFGLNQLYFTYGVGVDLWLARISFASYTQELGYRFRQNKDARVVFQVDAKIPF